MKSLRLRRAMLKYAKSTEHPMAGIVGMTVGPGGVLSVTPNTRNKRLLPAMLTGMALGGLGGLGMGALSINEDPQAKRDLMKYTTLAGAIAGTGIGAATSQADRLRALAQLVSGKQQGDNSYV